MQSAMDCMIKMRTSVTIWDKKQQQQHELPSLHLLLAEYVLRDSGRLVVPFPAHIKAETALPNCYHFSCRLQ